MISRSGATSTRRQVLDLLREHQAGLTAADLQDELNLTNGPVSVHLRKLEEEGHVRVTDRVRWSTDTARCPAKVWEAVR